MYLGLRYKNVWGEPARGRPTKHFWRVFLSSGILRASSYCLEEYMGTKFWDRSSNVHVTVYQILPWSLGYLNYVLHLCLMVPHSTSCEGKPASFPLKHLVDCKRWNEPEQMVKTL
jgi:hypothetical protein